VPDPEQAKPEPQAQRNFTDPASRLMKDGATKAVEQAYNAQVAVDSQAQIIVAAAVTPEAMECNFIGGNLNGERNQVRLLAEYPQSAPGGVLI